ncbi:hypothetical protein IPdc08_00106 [archaeon]|nr:hypothetical protein IPdc08_00106 [archaeon]
MNRGFIFTMDAILAMIPLFIILSAVTMYPNPGNMLSLQVTSSKDSMVVSNSMYVIAKEGVLTDIARNMISGADSKAANTAGKYLNSTLPEYFNYKLDMIYPNGTIKNISGAEPPVDASVSVASQIIPAFLGGQGYMGQAWYVGIPPSINMIADNVTNGSNIYLGECPASSKSMSNNSKKSKMGKMGKFGSFTGSTSCSYTNSDTVDDWYYFNFTVPGKPMFTAFIFTTNTTYHSFNISIKNNLKTNGNWVQVAAIPQVWYSTQVDLTNWTVGYGQLNQMRVKVYGTVNTSSPPEAYLMGNSRIISMYATGVNINVVVNDSSSNPNMNNSNFTLKLNTPDPAFYGKLIFSRLYLPAAWHTGQLEVWVDGIKRFNTGYGKHNWDNAATPAIIDLTQYLQNSGIHILTVDNTAYGDLPGPVWPWYASPTLVRTYVSGPTLLQTVNLPYNPPWPNKGGNSTQTYPVENPPEIFTVPGPSIPDNASITTAVYLLSADEDADTASTLLNNRLEINGSHYSYERYKFVTDDLKIGSNNVSTTLTNTKGDGFYVQGPGNQLLIGYKFSKLAFASGPGPNIETAKKNALQQLLIKMGYDTNHNGVISGTELDKVPKSIVNYTGSAPSDWVTNTSFIIDWQKSKVHAVAAQRVGQNPQSFIFKLYIWRRE